MKKRHISGTSVKMVMVMAGQYEPVWPSPKKCLVVILGFNSDT